MCVYVCVCARVRVGGGAEIGLETDRQIGRGQEDRESKGTRKIGKKNGVRESSRWGQFVHLENSGPHQGHVF